VETPTRSSLILFSFWHVFHPKPFSQSVGQRIYGWSTLVHSPSSVLSPFITFSLSEHHNLVIYQGSIPSQSWKRRKWKTLPGVLKMTNATGVYTTLHEPNFRCLSVVDHPLERVSMDGRNIGMALVLRAQDPSYQLSPLHQSRNSCKTLYKESAQISIY
jgi:hypothetical protein